jgi:hypothetical protein
MSGQRHTPAAYSRGKRRWYTLNGRLGGPQGGTGTVGKRKKHLGPAGNPITICVGSDLCVLYSYIYLTATTLLTQGNQFLPKLSAALATNGQYFANPLPLAAGRRWQPRCVTITGKLPCGFGASTADSSNQ